MIADGGATGPGSLLVVGVVGIVSYWSRMSRAWEGPPRRQDVERVDGRRGVRPAPGRPPPPHAGLWHATTTLAGRHR
jgi:hypothetical protein